MRQRLTPYRPNSGNSLARTPDRPPLVWLVIGDKLGDNAQVEVIAEALGWPIVRKDLRFREKYVLGKPPFRPSLYHIDLARSAPLAPPWPDIVLTIGRRPSMAAMWIKQQSAGRTRLVLVGRPKRMLHDYDLILATPQFRLPKRDNVMQLSLPLMRVDPQAIEAAREPWRERLAGLPRPLTAVMVGGQTKPFVFDGSVARQFLEALAASAGDAGTLYVTTSRRTPEDVVAAIEAALPANALLFRWRPDTDPADNPYRALLAWADRFVVTGDSVSMIVEVARLGRPLAIFPLPVASSRRARLRQRFADWFQPAPGATGRPDGRLARLGNLLFDLGLVGYSREIAALHQMLIDRRLASWLGEPFRSEGAPPADDLPEVVARIQRLVGPSPPRT